MRVSELVPDPKNPRHHDGRNLAAIERSMIEHGQVEPLVVQASSKMLIAGNARHEVMKRLGIERADVVVLDVDDVQARKLSIVLNRSGELATWDDTVLARHLRDLKEDADSFDPMSLGYSTEEMDDALKSLAEGDKRRVSFNAGSGKPPDQFPSFDRSLKTDHKCPKCSYEWSGAKK